MLHEKYEEYFKNGADSIGNIIKDHQIHFEKIKKVEQALLANKCNTPVKQRNALSLLGASLLGLKPIYTYSIFYCMELQNKAMLNHQQSYIKEPTHVKSKNAKGEEVEKLMAYSSTMSKAYGQKESSQYRRVSNFLKGYVEGIETNIMVLQSLLKSSNGEGAIHENEEKKLKQDDEELTLDSDMFEGAEEYVL